MPEPITLTTLLWAGAAAVSTEVVKEATKDAYRNLKDKVSDLFGMRAQKALDKLADVSTLDEGKKELERYVGDDLEPDEASEIEPLAQILIDALKSDSEAAKVVHSRIGIDVVSGGNVVIRKIKGAREAAVTVRADKDVTIEDWELDTGRDLGKPRAR